MQTLEVLLKLRKEGGEVLSQLKAEMAELKATVSALAGQSMTGKLEEGLSNIKGVAAGAKDSIKSLVDSMRSPESVSYLKGLMEGFSSLDKSALRAATSTKEFNAALASGGSNAGWALGILDALKQTSTEAENARHALGLINGVDTSAVQSRFNSLTEKLTQGLGADKAASEIGKIATSLNTVDPKNLDQVGSSMGKLRELAGVAATAIAGVIGVSYIKDATMAAARTEVLGTVLHSIAANAGMARSAIDAVDKSVQQMGITASSSRQSLSQMIQAGLDVTKYGAQLARASQDLAVVAGENSSATLQRLITNISQLDTMGLRWMGITLDIQGAEEKYAQSIGKTSAALTQKQKIEAVTIGVLDQARARTGLYEASMNDAGKQMQSLARYQEEVAVAIGNLFLPVLLEGVKGFTEFLKGAKAFVQGLDESGEASKAMGTAMKFAVSVLGDILKAVGSTTSLLVEHKGILLTIAGLYAAGLGMNAVIVVASAVVSAFGAMTAAAGGLSAALGILNIMSWQQMLMSLGRLVSFIPGMAALGGVIQSLGAAAMGASAGAIALTSALGLVVLAGTAYSIMKAVEAYWEMKKAQEDLAKVQKRFADELKGVSKSAMEAWNETSLGPKKLAAEYNDSIEDILAKNSKLVSAMAAGSAQYKVAMAATNPTDDQRRIIAEWEGKQKSIIDTIEKNNAALSRLDKTAGGTSEGFKTSTNAANDMMKGFKNTSEYVADFWNKLNDLNKVTFNDLMTSAKQAHDTLAAELSIDPERNWSKILQNDMDYYAKATQLAQEFSYSRKTLLDAELSDVKTNLQQEIAAKQKNNQDATADIKKLTEVKADELRRQDAIERESLATITALRDQALSAYQAQIQRITQLKREAASEEMSYEMKMFDLQTKLANDGFKVKEESLAARERALSQNTALSSEAKAAAQKALAAERSALEDQKRAHEKTVEGMVSSKIEELLSRARKALADGDIEQAKQLSSAAEGMTGRLGTVKEQMEKLTATHEVRAAAIKKEKEIAEASAAAQLQAFQALDKGVKDLKDTIEQLGFTMTKVMMESRLLQMVSEVDTKYREMSETLRKVKEAKEDVAKAEKSGDQSDIIAANKRYKDLNATLEEQAKAWGIASQNASQYKKAIDDLKPIKPQIDTANVKEAGDVLDRTMDKARALGKENPKIKVDAVSGDGLRPDGKGGWVSHVTLSGDSSKLDAEVKKAFDQLNAAPKPLKVTADVGEVQRGVQKAREEVGSIVKTWVVPITPQVDKEPLNALTQSLEPLRNVSMVVTSDTAPAMEQINAMQQKKPELKVEVKAEDTQATNDIEKMDNTKVDVGVDFKADTTAVDQASSQMEATPVEPVAVFRADDSQVMQAKLMAQQPTYSDHYIRVHEIQGNANGGYIQHLAAGGVPLRANNLVSGPGTGTSDSIFSMLSNGEFVMKAAAVSKYGLDLLYAMNSMVFDLPMAHLAEGGSVALPSTVQSIAPRLTGPAATQSRMEMDLNFKIGDRKYKVSTSRDTANELAVALKELARASGG